MVDDPYKVLCLGKDFTLDQLRSNYRRLALQLHPDKNRLSPETSSAVFQVLTASYKTLLRELETRTADRPFYILRQEARSHDVNDVHNHNVNGHNENVGNVYNGHNVEVSQSHKFDSTRFNRAFDENRLATPDDEGYQDWMKTHTVTKRKDKREMRVIQHVNPQPASLARKSIGYHELGVDRVDDFSKAPSLGQRQSIAFTDYRIAHTTSQLAEDDEIAAVEKRGPRYKNIKDLETERSSLRFNMNDAEQEAYLREKEHQEMQERRRLENLRRWDEKVRIHSERVNMLGLRAS